MSVKGRTCVRDRMRERERGVGGDGERGGVREDRETS
jgi:hypothetical protein